MDRFRFDLWMRTRAPGRCRRSLRGRQRRSDVAPGRGGCFRSPLRGQGHGRSLPRQWGVLQWPLQEEEGQAGTLSMQRVAETMP